MANGIPEQDIPLMDRMVGDMTGAFVGLGIDIMDEEPDVIMWSPRP